MNNEEGALEIVASVFPVQCKKQPCTRGGVKHVAIHEAIAHIHP